MKHFFHLCFSPPTVELQLIHIITIERISFIYPKSKYQNVFILKNRIASLHLLLFVMDLSFFLFT